MSDPNQDVNANAAGASAALSGQITVAAFVLIFCLFIAILILYLKAKGYSGTTGSFSSRRHRLSFATHQPTHPRLALDPSILNSLPITTFNSKNFNEEEDCIECAVCLCELSDGEEVRLLPKCNHVFHVECIDMWFHSNNTCPLCRSLVEAHANEKVVEIAVETQGENSVNKSNEEGSSSYMGSFPPPPSSSSRKRKEGMLMIDIPSRANGAFSSSNAPLSSSRVPSDSPLPTSRLLEEIKSPVMGRMKSLKRMLSRGRMSFKGVGTSYTSMGSDIEQGGVSDYKCR
ncbi:RING-H2 finger protein ATL2-like [Asparagus officinalis]|uniref:RING-H2 finger protein ATL2-like n=1 Tax=Asparagus officinalis TaxID=4686 RepID=UPI00098E1AC4|nr:RING-H2 finger protein ATL2-like [Asparagus officinalis]